MKGYTHFIYVVVMPWDYKDEPCLKPLDSFNTPEEAQAYIDEGHPSWQFLKVHVPVVS
nr:hypothetical protein [uncultured Methanobacterium sp.]